MNGTVVTNERQVPVYTQLAELLAGRRAEVTVKVNDVNKPALEGLLEFVEQRTRKQRIAANAKAGK